MRTLALVTILTITFFAFSCGGAKGESPEWAGNRTTEQQLLQIEEEWAAAAKNKVNPEGTLHRILAADWYFTGPHGDVFNREQMIAIIKANSDLIDRTEFFDVKVRVYGSVAVVTGGAREIGTRGDGRPYAEPYRWTDVFVRRDGRWQAVVSQATLLPQPSGARR